MRKKSTWLVFLVLLSTQLFANEKWNLTWKDEFDGNKLDSSKWDYIIGNGFWANGTWVAGWGNNEKEYYTDSEENVKVKDGKLIITAKNDSFQGEAAGGKQTFNYTSGKIVTQGKFSQKYGRVEFRAKLPKGKGLWPAIWMLPEEDVYGGWAASGEIDIIEGWGSDTSKIAGTLHYGGTWPANVHTGKDYHFKNGDATQWHEYALEWLPGEIRWYVDGELYQVQNNWYSKNKNEAVEYTYPAPFDQPFYLIMNLAVGGWFDGDPDGSTKFPETLEVDYIRVYELEGGYDENISKPKIALEDLPEDIKQPINGNFIYNGDFANDGENWQLLTHFGGAGSYTYETINGEKFLKANIENQGNQSYSIQVIQEAPIMKGRYYKLSFDAKAENNREKGIKIGGGESRGWAAYHTNTFNITKEVNRYTTMFQMIQDSDPNGKVEFHLGLSKLNVWLGNVKLEMIEDPVKELLAMSKAPLVNGNLVYNGSFDQGDQKRMLFWDFKADNSSAKVIERVLNIINNGDNPKLIQENIQLKQDAIYNIKFKAKSENGNSVKIILQDKNGNKKYFEKEVKLSNEEKEYKINFTNKNSTDLRTTLVFEFLGDKDKLTLDNIKMTEQPDYSKIQTVLIDDNFSKGSTKKNWTLFFGKDYGFGGESTFVVRSGTAQIKVKDIGAEEWSNILSQNVNIEKGIKYRVSFDISSSRTRDVRVSIENATYQRKGQALVKAEKKPKTYTIEFVADKSEEVGLKFLLGKVGETKNRPHTVKLDNVKFEVVKE